MCYCWNRLHDIVTTSRSFMLPLYAQNRGRNVNRMMWTEIRADLICRLNWSFWTESSWVACWVCSWFVARVYSWLAKWVPSSTTQCPWVSCTALWGVLLWITLEIATEKNNITFKCGIIHWRTSYSVKTNSNTMLQHKYSFILENHKKIYKNILTNIKDLWGPSRY